MNNNVLKSNHSYICIKKTIALEQKYSQAKNFLPFQSPPPPTNNNNNNLSLSLSLSLSHRIKRRNKVDKK